MHLSIPLAMTIFALITLSHAATSLLPTTTTCTALSPSCESACGPGYKSCGAEECYNPSLLESCCAANTTCPAGTFCHPEGHGCKAPTSLTPPGPNCTTSISAYSFSGTSSALTSLTALANGTLTITSASKPANLSLPVATPALSNNNTAVAPSSVVSGISAGPVANVTYAGTVPPTTGTVASPTTTGGVERACQLNSGLGVGLLVVIVSGALAVMGDLL